MKIEKLMYAFTLVNITSLGIVFADCVNSFNGDACLPSSIPIIRYTYLTTATITLILMGIVIAKENRKIANA